MDKKKQLFLTSADNRYVDPLSGSKALLAQSSAPSPKTLPAGSPSIPIPQEWKNHVLKVFRDACFCEAVLSVFLDFSKGEGPSALKPERVRVAFESAIETANRARFGTVEELRSLLTGKSVLGRLRAVVGEPQSNQIFLNPDLLSSRGNQLSNVIPSLPLYDLVFFHETLHQFFRTLNIKETPLFIEKISEHELQTLIWKRYFLNPLSKFLPDQEFLQESIAKEIRGLATACSLLGICAKNGDKEQGGSYMAPPMVPPVPHGPDINNDGIPDTIGDVLVGYEEKNETGAQDYLVDIKADVPVLRGPPPNWFGFELSEYSRCPAPNLLKPSMHGWVQNPPHPLNKSFHAFARFYNKHGAAFMAGEKAVLPGAVLPQVIRGIVVYIDNETKTTAFSPFAEFEGCHLVPLDLLALVTAGGERLDMQKVTQSMGHGMVKDMSLVESEAAEVLQEMAALKKSSFEKFGKLPEEKRDAEMLHLRDQVASRLHEITESFGAPLAWENSALIILGLPMQDYFQPPCDACCQAKSVNIQNP